MALNGIGGALSGLGLPSLQPRPTREGEEGKPARRLSDSAPERSRPEAARPDPRAPATADARVVPLPVKAAEAETVLSAEAPPGTDPAFWSVLTTEERQFFSKMQTLGPLTYGPKSAPPKAAMARGGRIDLKV